VTDITGYRGDPEGLLPEETKTEGGVEVREDYCIWINGLTKEQFDLVVKAASKDPRSRVGQFVGKTISLAALMILLAAAVRLIVWILSGLAINA
jgi:hypothetical protein